MSNIYFTPYMGDKYFDGFNGKKLLALQESYFGSEEDMPSTDLTTKLIESYLDPLDHFSHWKNSFRKFERCITGKELTQEEREDFFAHLAFYNYVQEGLSASQKVTKKQYKEAEEPFWETIDKLQPDNIVVWGYRLFDNLPKTNFFKDETIEIDGTKAYTGHYILNNGHKVCVIAIRHPAAAFSWELHHKIITQWFNR